MALAWLFLNAQPSDAQTLAIQPQFDDAGHFHEGIAPVMSGGQWGFIDRKGGWVVRPTYDSVKSGSGGRFAVEKNGRWGFVNSAGAVVVKPAYDEVQPFQDGVAAVRRGALWGFIGPTGAIDVAPKYTALNSREVGFYTAQNQNGEWETIDPRGSAMIILYYDPKVEAHEIPETVTGFVEEYAIVLFNAGKGLRHRKEAWESDWFEDVSAPSEGLAAFSEDGERWGYLVLGQGAKIAPRFERARAFGEGLAPVRLSGKWGFIDTQGGFVVPPRYDQAYAFSEGFALMRVGDKRGFLRHSGSEVTEWVPPKYEDAYRFQEGLAPVKENGEWGYISSGVDEPIVRDVADLLPQ